MARKPASGRPDNFLASRKTIVAVSRVYRTLGYRKFQSVQRCPQWVDAIPCQKSIGGLVLRMCSMVDCSGRSAPLSAVTRVILV